MPRYTPPIYWAEVRIAGKSLEWWLRTFMATVAVLISALTISGCCDWLFPPNAPQQPAFWR